MPVWNRAEIVSRAIRSVLAQTFDDYELIIVDDGSGDDLQARVRPFLSGRIRYFARSHEGVSAARNFGIRQSSHAWIAYLDSDNVWHSDFLLRMSKCIEAATGRVHAAYCQCRIFNRHKPGEIVIGGRPFNYTDLLEESSIDINTLVHTREILEFCGLHDESLKRLTDWDLILRITEKVPLLFVPEVLVDYHLFLCDNAISKREGFWRFNKKVLETHWMKNRTVRFVHDTVEYSWRNVSDEKRLNWVRMNQREFNTRDFTAWGYPYVLQVEPTTACNLACPLCPCGTGELDRPTRHLKLGEFRSLIDDMERYLLFLILWDWGEPLTNPDLPAMIRYASERGIQTVTSTNGHFFHNDAYMDELLTSGLTNLIVAIDSLSAESYQVYRKKGELDGVVTGLEKLVAAKKRLKSGTQLNLRMVVMKQNEQDVEKLRRFARDIGMDCFTLKTLNPICGTASMDEELVPQKKRYRRFEYAQGTMNRIRDDKPCARVWRMSNIFSNGDVAPCCYDFTAEMKVGNILERPFTEIWNSPAYSELRRRIYQEAGTIRQCRDCVQNFRESTGMFVEKTQFKARMPDHPFDTLRDFLLTPPVRRRLVRVREIITGSKR
jgi:radical SAM protein with 4Fe4S-binding SPASM domain